MANAWLMHLQEYHKKHPQNSYKKNMQLARASYTPQTGNKTTKKTKKQKGKGFGLPQAQLASQGLNIASHVGDKLFDQLNSPTAVARRTLRQVKMSTGGKPLTFDQALQVVRLSRQK